MAEAATSVKVEVPRLRDEGGPTSLSRTFTVLTEKVPIFPFKVPVIVLPLSVPMKESPVYALTVGGLIVWIESCPVNGLQIENWSRMLTETVEYGVNAQLTQGVEPQGTLRACRPYMVTVPDTL